VTVAVSRIERGAVSNVKGVGEGVLEFRLDFGPGYRIYFGRDGDHLVILLTGGTKRRQDEDIAEARARWNNYKARKARVARDPAFKEALLTEGLTALLEGDLGAGKAVLRDYINATIGFEALATATGTPAKSLMRMFGPRGNPSASNLFAVIGRLQQASGITLEVRAA
jgi:putative addiction module killer protein